MEDDRGGAPPSEEQKEKAELKLQKQLLVGWVKGISCGILQWLQCTAALRKMVGLVKQEKDHPEKGSW